MRNNPGMRRVKTEELQKAGQESTDAVAALMSDIRKHTNALPEPVRASALRYFSAIDREVELEMELENSNADDESCAGKPD
jgi:hypothetical protein